LRTMLTLVVMRCTGGCVRTLEAQCAPKWICSTSTTCLVHSRTASRRILEDGRYSCPKSRCARRTHPTRHPPQHCDRPEHPVFAIALLPRAFCMCAASALRQDIGPTRPPCRPDRRADSCAAPNLLAATVRRPPTDRPTTDRLTADCIGIVSRTAPTSTQRRADSAAAPTRPPRRPGPPRRRVRRAEPPSRQGSPTADRPTADRPIDVHTPLTGTTQVTAHTGCFAAAFPCFVRARLHACARRAYALRALYLSLSVL
jgi:hypothetical protein